MNVFRADRMGWLVAAVVLLIGVLVAVVVGRFVQPAPPTRIVMSTGAAGGAYHAFAERYREILARRGVTRELRPSAGAVQNLERLRRREDGVSVALVQSGLVRPEQVGGLVSLGTLFYEPLWLFVRRDLELDELVSLHGRRIAVGAPGSGTRALGLTLAQAAGLGEAPTVLVEIGGEQAVAALESGEVDAAFFVAAPEAPIVRRLLESPRMRFFEPKGAAAISRRFPFLRLIDIPAGAIDLARRIPASDLTLLSATASLVAVEEIHPVVVDLLLGAAKQVHGGGGLLHDPGVFPVGRDADFPVSPDAERFYTSGPPALQRYLPFWVAVWVQRALFFIVPFLALVIPVFQVLPIAFRWQMRRRIYRHYAELRRIERSLSAGEDPEDMLAQLETLGSQVNALKVPAAYSSELYTLRFHIDVTRERAEHMLAQRESKARPA